jgi:hypothetical protein
MSATRAPDPGALTRDIECIEIVDTERIEVDAIECIEHV